MTYCVGILLEKGLVVAADTRSNAGIDHIMTVRKLHLFEKPGERVIMLLSAGNLAITQSVVGLLKEQLESGDPETDIMAADSMYRVARIVGAAIREIHDIDAEHLKANGADFNASFLLGGQVKGGQLRLFNIYAAGNFIEATPDTPYIQIGETKYGKPVLDRLVRSDMELDKAAKSALISYCSTMRSNVSVGLPIDLIAYEKDSLKVTRRATIEPDDPYFETLSKAWGRALEKAFLDMPEVELESVGSA